jgi:hypothetical protein
MGNSHCPLELCGEAVAGEMNIEYFAISVSMLTAICMKANTIGR